MFYDAFIKFSIIYFIVLIEYHSPSIFFSCRVTWQPTPTRVESLRRVKYVVAADSHTLAVVGIHRPLIDIMKLYSVEVSIEFFF